MLIKTEVENSSSKSYYVNHRNSLYSLLVGADYFFMYKINIESCLHFSLSVSEFFAYAKEEVIKWHIPLL
jgi:hypothetical protein